MASELNPGLVEDEGNYTLKLVSVKLFGIVALVRDALIR